MVRLRHTWGDAVCGDDNAADTPPQRYSNGFGDNPATFYYKFISIPCWFINQKGCIADSLNWAGEMFVNCSIGSAIGQCVTMFAEGQSGVSVTLLEKNGDLRI